MSPQNLKISPKDLNDLVDSSLRLADIVLEDDQDIKGELWIVRHAVWRYLPFSFRISYHVLKDEAMVIFFRCHRVIGPSQKITIRDTETYRNILKEADQWRKMQP